MVQWLKHSVQLSFVDLFPFTIANFSNFIFCSSSFFSLPIDVTPFITSAQEGYVFTDICLFVSKQDFHNQFSRNSAERWPWKKRLDFGGNLDHIMLGTRLRLELG